MDESNGRLILYLRNLADSIERRELSSSRLQSVGEFYMRQQFREQAKRDGHATSPSPSRRTFRQQDLVKFITVGWYLYCCLLGEYELVVDDESSDSETEETEETV